MQMTATQSEQSREAFELKILEVELAMCTATNMVFPYVTSAIVVAVGLVPSVPWFFVVGWLCGYAAQIYARWALTRTYYRLTPEQRAIDPDRWVRLMLLSAIGFGFVWGAIPLIAFPHASVEMKLLWTFFIVTVNGMVAAVAIPRQLISILSFTVPSLLISWLVWGGRLGWLMAAFQIVFLLVYFVIGRRQNKVNLERISLFLHNEELAKKLSKKNAELAQINQAKTEMIAVASHDLRQPVHALGMLVELMNDASPAEMKARLASVKTCVDSLTEMLTQLLEFNRLELGLYQPTLSPVSIDGLCKEIVEMYEGLAQYRGLLLNQSGKPVNTFSDAQLLRRIISNLVHNAIKFTRSGGISLTWREQNGMIQLNIKDTGRGIEADKLEGVFKEYIHHGFSNDPEQGTGLGLSIVQRGCRILGHQITVHSELGVGTTFTLWMRATDDAHHAREITPLPNAFKSSASVLVIDNDPLVLDSVVATLQGWGCMSIGAPTLDCMLQQLDESNIKPDLIISDLHLSGDIDGFNAIDALRQTFESPTLPAMLITGDIDPTVEIRAQMLGIILAHKPLRPSRLRKLMATALGNI